MVELSRPGKESPYHLRAEHDEIFIGSLDWVMSDQDKAKMDALGFTADEDAEGWRASV